MEEVRTPKVMAQVEASQNLTLSPGQKRVFTASKKVSIENKLTNFTLPRTGKLMQVGPT